MEERYLKHDVFEIVVHWAMAASIIMLILSGLTIRFPAVVHVVTMNSSRFLHFVFMYLLIFSWLAHIYHTFAYEFETEVVNWKDIKGIPAMIRYYLLVSETRPAYLKYNPLQKTIFNIVWVMILVQVATGLLLYWPAATMGISSRLGGLMAARILHDFMTYLFISFIIVHVSLVLSGDVRALWAMFHGYYYRRVDR